MMRSVRPAGSAEAKVLIHRHKRVERNLGRREQRPILEVRPTALCDLNM
jgi:hypothetical protein